MPNDAKSQTRLALEDVKREVEKTPEHRMREKKRSMVVGTGLLVLGIAAHVLLGWTMWLTVAAAVVAGIMISRQLTLDAAIAIAIGLLRDLVDVALRWKSGRQSSIDD